MKSRSVSNSLDALSRGAGRNRWCRHDDCRRRIVVVQGDCRLIRNGKGPLECGSQIRILSASVPGIPTEIYVQAEQIREPLADFRFVDARCGTALQNSKWIKVNRLCAMGS